MESQTLQGKRGRRMFNAFEFILKNFITFEFLETATLVHFPDGNMQINLEKKRKLTTHFLFQ
jgi:hypothetical protein